MDILGSQAFGRMVGAPGAAPRTTLPGSRLHSEIPRLRHFVCIRGALRTHPHYYIGAVEVNAIKRRKQIEPIPPVANDAGRSDGRKRTADLQVGRLRGDGQVGNHLVAGERLAITDRRS